jgi:hypothetical protein
MLSRDILRLLVRNNPTLANGLMRTSKRMYDWVITDRVLMSEIGEYYHKKLSNGLSFQVRRLFHLSAAGSGIITDVYISEYDTGKKRCYVSSDKFGFGSKRTKELNEIKSESDNPQSKMALKQIQQIGYKAELLRRQELINDEESFQQMDDVVKGVQHVVDQAMTYKAGRKWSWTGYLWCCFAMLCVSLITLIFYQKRLPFALELVSIGVIAIIYYRKNLGREILLF